MNAQVGGKRHGRYNQASSTILGRRAWTLLLTASQQVNLFLANLGYQTAAADSLGCGSARAVAARAAAAQT